jgi:hypothetical protein
LATTVLLILAITVFRQSEARLHILDVNRINIRNPDGGLALVIAGRGQRPGPTFDGQEYPPELSGGPARCLGYDLLQ